MSCPTEDHLALFAIDPLCEGHEAIATHVFECGKCCSELKRINSVLFEDVEVSASEMEEARAFLSRKKSECALWGELRTKVLDFVRGRLCVEDDDSDQSPAAFLECTFGKVAALTSSFLLAGMLGATVSSCGHGSSGDKSDLNFIQIEFVSDCDKSNPFYWRAKLMIPPTVEDDSALAVILSDRNGALIPRGMFCLMGNELTIHDGIAEIAFKTFRESLANTTVFIRSFSGKEISGNLTIC